MPFAFRFVSLIAVSAAIAAVPGSAQKTTGPKATYAMDVSTTSGIGMGAMMGGRGGAAQPAWQRSLAADGGFPLKVTNHDGVVQLEVTKIEQKKLADALFTVPANYSKMDMPRRP